MAQTLKSNPTKTKVVWTQTHKQTSKPYKWKYKTRKNKTNPIIDQQITSIQNHLIKDQKKIKQAKNKPPKKNRNTSKQETKYLRNNETQQQKYLILNKP